MDGIQNNDGQDTQARSSRRSGGAWRATKSGMHH